MHKEFSKNTKQSKAGKEYKIELSDKIYPTDSSEAKQKRPGYKRPIKEVFHGHKPSRDKEKYPLGVTEHRVIDRIEDRYDQVVKDNLTGEICHEEHEPLSEHKGKREAKSKNKFKQTEIGRIPEDWEVKKIKDVATVNEQTINSSFKYEEIEYIDISSVDKGKIIEIRKLPLDKAPSRAKRIVRNNDIIISTVRPNLKHFAFIKKAKPNTIVSTGFAVISPKKIIPSFLYYYITTNHYTEYLTAIADTHTSTYPAFNPDVIEESIIPFPPLPEQKAIAKILSSFDDKIELNQRMNKTLEAIAQAIFKRWFIDFEFPNEEGKPYKSSGGEMVYNEELGKEIPKGWEVKTLKDISYNFDSKRIPLSSRERQKRQGIYPYYGATGIMDFIDNYIFDGVYVLMAEDGSVMDEKGYPIVQYVWGKFWVNNHAHVLQGKGISNEFLYLLLKNKNIQHIVTGAVQPKINQTNMNSLKFAIPPKYFLKSFDKTIQPLFRIYKHDKEQISTLSQIRDVLLPKLMSGEIRVKVDEVKWDED